MNRNRLALIALTFCLAAPALAQERFLGHDRSPTAQDYAKKAYRHAEDGRHKSAPGAGQDAGLDADGDGYLSVDEIVEFELNRAREHLEKRVEARVRQLDRDGDGLVSAEEIALGGPVISAPVFPPVAPGEPRLKNTSPGWPVPPDIRNKRPEVGRDGRGGIEQHHGKDAPRR